MPKSRSRPNRRLRLVPTPELRDALRSTRLTGTHLAMRSGCQPTDLSHVEQGCRFGAGARRYLLRLGELLGVPADRCFTEVDKDEEYAPD